MIDVPECRHHLQFHCHYRVQDDSAAPVVMLANVPDFHSVVGDMSNAHSHKHTLAGAEDSLVGISSSNFGQWHSFTVPETTQLATLDGMWWNDNSLWSGYSGLSKWRWRSANGSHLRTCKVEAVYIKSAGTDPWYHHHLITTSSHHTMAPCW